MNFPEQVNFRLIDKKTNKPVNNIAVTLILYAHKKNNYFLEPKISDDAGEVSFTKDDCLKSIENSKRFYLMDYISTLEQCLPFISIEIISRDIIDSIIRRRRANRDIYQKYWNCSEEYLRFLENSDNHKYVNKTYEFTESDLWQNKILEITLEPAVP